MPESQQTVVLMCAVQGVLAVALAASALVVPSATLGGSILLAWYVRTRGWVAPRPRSGRSVRSR